MVRPIAAALAVGVAFISLMATAQDASQQPAAPRDEDRFETLAGTLSDGLNCNGASLQDALGDRARRSGEAPADIGVALALISSDANICPPIRMAASALSQDIAAKQAAAQQTAALALAAAPPPAASDPQAEASLEAEVRAESAKFADDPPPRNLTRTRIASP
ncbi:MAG: hypothetical protein GC155_02060 [Alphaproteobacteria bacterium]|nr:hypothetical protein [Alphaproteobacteria bacterium]